MKKFLLAVLVLVGFVVGLQGSQQQVRVPDSLVLGTGLPTPWVGIGIYTNSPDGNGMRRAAAIDEPVTNGNLVQAAQDLLVRFAQEFKSSPGAENLDYALSITIDTGDYSLASKNIPVFPGTFKLEGGKIPDKFLEVNLSYQSYLAYRVEGLKGVLLVVRQDGEEIVREESKNGVADTTCTLYPANDPYFNPNILRLHSRYMLPEVRESGVEGEVTVYLSTDKSIWAKYDLDGVKLASSEPILSSTPPVPLALAISLVQLDDGGQIVLQSKKSLQWGLKLRVEGPAGKSVVLEYADKLGDDANWQRLTTVSLASGLAEHVDELVPTSLTRFYRVR